MKELNESGRSMVEMLGVLAIIGVLSVGGIAGYTQAMKKYRANEITNTISMAAVLCQTKQSPESVKTTMVPTLGCTGDAVTFTIADGLSVDTDSVYTNLKRFGTLSPDSIAVNTSTTYTLS